MLGAALFGGLSYGSAGMSFGADVPPEIIRIVIGSVIFFVATQGIVKWVLIPFYSKRKKERARNMDFLTMLNAFFTKFSELINTTLVYSTALIFGALGGIYSERSGIVNIGIEGLMVSGAFASAVGAYYAEEANMGIWSPWIGLLMRDAIRLIFALIHAVATITFKANQVISGVVINFLAAGVTLYLVKVLFNGAGQTETLNDVFSKWEIPMLSKIPYIGYALFTCVSDDVYCVNSGRCDLLRVVQNTVRLASAFRW